MSGQWIGTESSLSNGAAYADLDNDGDLDIVVNNLNGKPFIYRNDLPLGTSNFLKIRLEGERANRFGVGSKVLVHAGGRELFYEQIPSRGWLSSVDYVMHIGLGNLKRVDSISIRWPDNKSQTLKSIRANETITVRQSDAVTQGAKERKESAHRLLLTEEHDVAFKHKENNFIAFSVERLIPHMASTQGPKLSVADVNGDKLDDFFVGGAAGQPGAIFIQSRKGNFKQSVQPSIASDSLAEDVGAAFFDADGNGTLDLIVINGGQEFSGKHKNLLPRLYLNDGEGNFKRITENIPPIFVNASCVKPADVDSDGDSDLFIGGRVVAGQYGVDPPSFLLINDGHGVFKDETTRLLPILKGKGTSLGMVTDAVWLDINKDDRIDLVVIGEWMPITILIQNESGVFENRTEEHGLANTNGWWNTIAAHDFDKDGDTDFVVGNLGLNSRLRASVREPVSIFIGDIDNNNSLDHILTYYNQGNRYPFISRDQLVKQVPSLKRKFLKFANYRNVVLEDILEPTIQQKVIRRDVFTFASIYMENLGNGKFSIANLPVEGQVFPVFAFCIEDLDQDGNADILAAGNLDDTQPDFGRYDAGYGLTLIGNGKGSFKPVGSQLSGFVVKGQSRDIKSLVTSTNEKLFLISRNNDSIKLFRKTKKVKE